MQNERAFEMPAWQPCVPNLSFELCRGSVSTGRVQRVTRLIWRRLFATVLLCFECTNASLLSMTTGFSLGMCQRKGSNFPRQIIPLRQSTQREPGRSLTLFRANDVPFTV